MRAVAKTYVIFSGCDELVLVGIPRGGAEVAEPEGEKRFLGRVEVREVVDADAGECEGGVLWNEEVEERVRSEVAMRYSPDDESINWPCRLWYIDSTSWFPLDIRLDLGSIAFLSQPAISEVMITALSTSSTARLRR